MRLATAIFSFALLLALAVPAPARATILVYEQGSVGFKYAQFPAGSYGGTFFADGNVTDPDAFPPGGSGASVAVRATVAGIDYLVIFGGLQNTDDTADVSFIFLKHSSPLAPGDYPVDPVGFSALFGFVDDASNLDLPIDPHGIDWQAWIEEIVADHKLVSASGSIHLTKVTNHEIQGTFAGLAGDFVGSMMVKFEDGEFNLDPPPLSVDQSSWGSIKNLYR
ncbi:MAG TPA: hypothetical protein VFR10_09915 [bacterium]|nr:hypothetical protein [bacterium]